MRVRKLEQAIIDSWGGMKVPLVLCTGGDSDPMDEEIINCFKGKDFRNVKLENVWIEENTPFFAFNNHAAGYYLGAYLLLALRYVDMQETCWSNSIAWFCLFLNSKKVQVDSLPFPTLVKRCLDLLVENIELFPVIDCQVIERVLKKFS